MFISPSYIFICTLKNGTYFSLKNHGNLPKGKLKLSFGLMPKIPDPVPESALELSVNQIRTSWVFVSPIIPVYNDTDDLQ
jgi:hypothetical protein